MRNRVKCVMLAILIVAIVSCMVFAQVDAPQRSKDLRDFLEQPPNNVYQEFGYSEETLLLYNIIANRERLTTSRQQIARQLKARNRPLRNLM